MVTQLYELRNRMPTAFPIIFQLQMALLCIGGAAVPVTYDLPEEAWEAKAVWACLGRRHATRFGRTCSIDLDPFWWMNNKRQEHRNRHNRRDNVERSTI